MSKVELYDNLAGSYDLLISWKRRLRREKPFLNALFKRHKVRRILDTACGTGAHALAFHDWGYHVTGADLSKAMVKQSRANADGRKIHFVQAGFDDTEKIGGMFDAVTCLGNSLPHVLTDEALDASLLAFLDQLLAGGILVIHSNNYDRVLGRKERFMPLAHTRKNGKDHLFMRFFDFQGDILTFNVVSLTNESGAWSMFPDSSTHRAITRDLLVSRLRAVGFEAPEVYGSFSGEAFDPLESDNLIVLARKPDDSISRPILEPISALDRVPIHDNGEDLVNVEDIVPGVKVKQPPTFVRKTVGEMLAKAAAMLPEGHHFFIRTGCRSLEFQERMYKKYYGELAEKYPDWQRSQLRREINKYLAPPDAKHPPGHTTGGAVDLTIIGPHGGELDMNSTVKPLDNHFRTFGTYSKLITPRAAKNRQMLVDVMLAAGFSNFSNEWWHYSYGDSGWAVRANAPEAFYGASEFPVDCTP